MSAADEGLRGVPLPELFRRATALVAELDARPYGAPESRALLADGIRLLRLASELVEAAGLFSPNEDKDDLATSDLKYLLLPYYLGELLAQGNPGDLAAKRGMLGSAEERYMSFLLRARQYNLLGPEAAAMLAQLEAAGSSEGSEGNEGSSSRGSGGSGGGQLDPATLRQNKILKFKREKEINARLEALQRRRAATGEEEGEEEDESEREAWLLQIDLAGMKAAEKVGLLRQEVALLAHAASLPEGEREKARAPPPPELKAKLLAAAGALQQQGRHAGAAATLAGGERERLRAQVFRPSHILPSMTVEQFGEQEVAAAREREAREGERERREAARRGALTEEEREDEDVAKQRAWDEFQDDNPRGWGNSKTRPCG